MSARSQPPFSDARGLAMAMQSVPPFEFEGVTMRIFPLRAKTEIVQRFVDAWLNIVPPEVGYFRAYLPYVLLDLINYGRMSVVAANLGWLSQREIAFSVPLEWYKLVDGRYVFHDWAYLSPFIYVDSNISMTTGREVYGWPKALIAIDRDESDWMKDPRSPGRLATVSATVFPEVYAGRKEEPRPFLEVERTIAPSPLQFPPDYGRIFGPWLDVPGMLHNASSLMRDWVDLLSGVGVLRNHPGVGMDNVAEMSRLIVGSYRPYDSRPYFNTVNLKQFRAADRPSAICYQALTNARMDLTGWNAGGLLGDPQALAGDPSGGLRVFVHRYTSEPVIEMLGLEVEEEWHGKDTMVASLAPVYPYWMDVDMRYNLPRTEAWRTKVKGWTDSEGRSHPRHEGEPEGPPPYNTARGAASQQIGGPFEFPDTTLRVLPLLADRGPLMEFCDAYLNVPLAETGMSFEPWGTYVYLVIGSNEGATSESNNVGYWAGRAVTFYVPVSWYERVDGERRLRTLALVPVFSYANSSTAANTGSEVSGVPTVRVSIESPDSTWMDGRGPSDGADHRLLEMTAEVLPVLGEGQQAEYRKVMEVRDGLMLPWNDEVAWRFVAQSWGQRLKDDLARMRTLADDHPVEMDSARALALELLANGEPINVLTMKQFRACDDPSAACYQSLIQIRHRIQRIHDLREIEDRIYVRVHTYASQPIVKTLGLVAKNVATDGAMTVAELEPVRPFWMRAAMREELGITVRRRAGSLEWETDPDTLARTEKPYFDEDAPKPRVGRDLVRLIDAWVPQRLAPQALEWRGRVTSVDLGLSEAREAVSRIEPQMVIQSVLSREWENWGDPRWWRVKSRLAKEMDRIESQSLMTDAVEEQIAYLERELSHARATTRRQDVLIEIDREDLLNKLRLAGGMLEVQQRARDLAATLDGLAGGVVRYEGAGWKGEPCERVILSADEREVTQAFAGDAMFEVLEEAIRTTQFRMRAHGEPVVPTRRDEFCAAFARSLQRAPEELRKEVAAKAGELAGAWSNQAADELMRLFLHDDKDSQGVFQMLRTAVEAAGVEGGNVHTERTDYLLWLWARLQEREERMRAIAEEAVRVAKDRFAWVRAALMHALSKTAQKPDLCFSADTIQGLEQALFFPDSQCARNDLGGVWFVGPDPGVTSPTHVDGIPLPLVSAAQK